ncbi:MAG: GDP-mannose 4,6-dehydratase [Alphaproteobacteria bacterium]|nr:GDP-mannose 4,6-dehydratase [Alphaproteobacteria bacterium]MBU0796060.1 GDP-mannose 4,6-dehydratase [Alphaproteobacteria bacterium]MBU0886638.1 GDP-mannose 4,6-dehydratase [Alphaproteobacteria bacterium]MBU1814492.1 GDP-mannose 4,6-dehydratase [Alphaproteobacteria bacterium]
MRKDHPKAAFVTGVTGQDGSYMAEFLLSQGYAVHGLKRPSSVSNTQRIEPLMQDAPQRFFLHEGDLTDSAGMARLVQQVQPDEIYNLAAQSRVDVSFDAPAYTATVDALGPLYLLEAIRLLGLAGKTRFYQASTSELFGHAEETPQSETTPFRPCSPYGVAKLYAYGITATYRRAYGLHACNGILFNHESPRRGEGFVTRKITRGLARLAQGLGGPVSLGNLDARRDWGHARDYVRMQWLMLQQPEPEDFVIATGQSASVRDFLCLAADELGLTLRFQGAGATEAAFVARIEGDQAPALRVGDPVMVVDPRHFRPLEVPALCGDATKAGKHLGWRPEVTLPQLCAEMVAADLAAARREAALRVPDHAMAEPVGD